MSYETEYIIERDTKNPNPLTLYDTLLPWVEEKINYQCLLVEFPHLKAIKMHRSRLSLHYCAVRDADERSCVKIRVLHLR